MNRKIIYKNEIIFTLLLVLAAVCLLFYIYKPSGTFAEITIDGLPVTVVSLQADGVFDVETNPDIRFEIKNGAIRFLESNCPDKICVRTGFVTRAGQTAVCLPNKAVLRILPNDLILSDATEVLDAVL